MIQVAVVIVSYNTVALLRKALASVAAAEAEALAEAAARASAPLAVRTIVVDNASADGSAAMVRAEFPAVTLVALTRNLGFPAANNLALARLGLVAGDTPLTDEERLRPAPDHVLLLNPDAEIGGEALLQLIDFLQAHPEAGMVGPRLAYGDGSFQHGAFAFPGALQVALDLFPLGRLPGAHRLYAGRLNGRYPQAQWQGGVPFAVDFVLGAALCVRAETVRDIGGMDEGYFMYCEEMDWALRARQAGWGVFTVPGATVLHHEAQSSRQVRWTAWQRLWESRLRFYALHESAFPRGTLAAVQSMTAAAMRGGIWRARRRFAHGGVTGAQSGDEIAARQAVLAAVRALRVRGRGLP